MKVETLFRQAPQQNLQEQMDPELARLHREGACPFFAAAQKAKAMSVDEKILKLEDGTQIPIDDVAEIFESFSLDDVGNGESDEEDRYIVEENRKLYRLLICF